MGAALVGLAVECVEIFLDRDACRGYELGQRSALDRIVIGNRQVGAVPGPRQNDVRTLSTLAVMPDPAKAAERLDMVTPRRER